MIGSETSKSADHRNWYARSRLRLRLRFLHVWYVCHQPSVFPRVKLGLRG